MAYEVPSYHLPGAAEQVLINLCANNKYKQENLISCGFFLQKIYQAIFYMCSLYTPRQLLLHLVLNPGWTWEDMPDQL